MARSIHNESAAKKAIDSNIPKGYYYTLKHTPSNGCWYAGHYFLENRTMVMDGYHIYKDSEITELLHELKK